MESANRRVKYCECCGHPFTTIINTSIFTAKNDVCEDCKRTITRRVRTHLQQLREQLEVEEVAALKKELATHF